MSGIEKSVSRLVIEIFATILCILPLIIAIAVILSGSDKNCENPIREWLIVWACVNGFGMILIIAQSTLAKVKGAGKCLRLVSSFYVLFGLAWLIVGSVWLFTDDTCQDCKGYLDFYEMWAITLAILVIAYATFAFAICGCFIICCMVCCGKGSFKGMMAKVQT